MNINALSMSGDILHTEGVTGSIPVAPTIKIKNLANLPSQP